MPVVRWTFTDRWGTGPEPHTWTVPINPNEGGSPQIEKQLTISSHVGTRRAGMIQEGRMTLPTLSFSGVILTQEHLETFEIWFAKRILIVLNDDLGRTFQGVFSAFSPERVRRGTNPWFHNYSASFATVAYRNASGKTVYGRML